MEPAPNDLPPTSSVPAQPPATESPRTKKSKSAITAKEVFTKQESERSTNPTNRSLRTSITAFEPMPSNLEDEEPKEIKDYDKMPKPKGKKASLPVTEAKSKEKIEKKDDSKKPEKKEKKKIDVFKKLEKIQKFVFSIGTTIKDAIDNVQINNHAQPKPLSPSIADARHRLEKQIKHLEKRQILEQQLGAAFGPIDNAKLKSLNAQLKTLDTIAKRLSNENGKPLKYQTNELKNLLEQLKKNKEPTRQNGEAYQGLKELKEQVEVLRSSSKVQGAKFDLLNQINNELDKQFVIQEKKTNKIWLHSLSNKERLNYQAYIQENARFRDDFT